MKKQKLIVIIIMAIIANLSIVSAAGNTYTFNIYSKDTQNPINGFDAVYYQCQQNTCLDQTEPFKFSTINSGTTNSVKQEYLGTSQSNPTDYLTLIYAQCYLPLSIRVHNDWGYGQTFNYDFNAKKASECHASIEAFTILNNVSVNKPLWINVTATLDADTHSAFGKTGYPPLFTPSGYEDQFSANTNIILEIKNQFGTIVNTQNIQVEILADNVKHVNFVWTPQVDGNYIARITTQVIDCQCSSDLVEYVESSFDVLPDEPTGMCYTILNNLVVDNDFPDENEIITFTVEKTSNHVNGSGNLTPVGTILLWDILNLNTSQLAQFLPQNIQPNPDELNPVPVNFTWIPQEAGEYLVTITGNVSDLLCDGLNTTTQSQSKTVVVKEKLVLCTDQDTDRFFVEGENCGAIDCDDTNANINPAALEICNGVDDDCNGLVDENNVCGIQCTDIDSDGFAIEGGQCGLVDCDDNNNVRFPGNTEICDNFDNDCDNQVDEGGVCSPVCIPSAEVCDSVDNDCDGSTDEGGVCDPICTDNDGDGFAIEGGECGLIDCDDNNFFISPIGFEIPYDGIDQNCDGTDLNDVDKDGYIAVQAGGLDCNDVDAQINPGATEICEDNIDNNCNGQIDENCEAECTDNDGDVFKIEGGECGPIDCDDNNIYINPDATEICNELDDDCNGQVDEGDVCEPECVPETEVCDSIDNDCDNQVDEGNVCSVTCTDNDGDGFNVEGGQCGTIDCDDTNNLINPLGIEIPYNGVDENCDGVDLTDVDSDGYIAIQVGGPDCNDNNPLINPSANEICNDNIDNNCNGLIDETCTVPPTCTPSTEICNGLDDDCDTLIDENNVCMGPHPTCTPSVEVCNGLDDDCDLLVDEGNVCVVSDQNVTVQIQASKTLGRLPIQVWFTTTVTSGDSPFTYSWNFGDNRFSLEKDPVHIYSKEGFYKATVTVVDADGDIGTASINIDAEGKKALDSRSAVHVSDVSFVNDVISSGDTLDVIASFKNNAGQTVKDATITVSIPELGISQMAKQSKLKDGEKMSRLFYLDTPYYTQPGFYYVRAAFSANSGNVRRVVYREIQIK